MKIASYKIEEYIKNIDQQKIAGCLVYGPESSLIDFYCKKICQKIVNDLSDPFLVVNISKEKLNQNPTAIIDEFFSFSMLGGRKLILVNDSSATVTNAIKQLISDEDFAKKSDNFILIQAGDLEKSNGLRKIFEDSQTFTALPCYEENDVAIKRFIAEELKINNIKFNSDVVDFLYENLGGKRDIISLEIKKISFFLGSDLNLTLEKIESLIVEQSELSVNNFIQNFAYKKYGKSLILAKKLMNDGHNAITLIRFLSNHFYKLFSAKNEIENLGTEFELAAKKQKIFFKIEVDFKKQLKVNSLSHFAKILHQLQQLELAIKQGKSSPEVIFYKFIQKNR